MIETDAIGLVYDALWLVLLLSTPPIIAVALVGLVIALIQAATQLQEQTTQFAAKFIVISIVIFVTASWLGGGLFQFSDRVFSNFSQIVRR